MDVQSVNHVNAPLAVASMLPEANLVPQTEQRAAQQKNDDQVSVRVNLSSSSQNIFTNAGDLQGGSPVKESSKSESNPSDSDDQNSRDAEDKAGTKSQDLAKALKTLLG